MTISKRKNPLKKALRMVDKAVDIACDYVNAQEGPPTEKELGLLEDLAESLAIYTDTIEAVTRNWRLRTSEEPIKFTDPFAGPEIINHHLASRRSSGRHR